MKLPQSTATSLLQSPSTTPSSTNQPPRILAIDIGGTGLKAVLLSAQGQFVSERQRMPTPHPCSTDQMIAALVTLCAPLTGYERIAIGFPGVVRNGRIVTAPHFEEANDRWAGFALADALSTALGGKPARLVNDAEMQGLAAIGGRGLELVLTLGTGAGTALFRDGELMPHLELAHHPIRGSKTYNDYVGNIALRKIGGKRWNRRVRKTIEILDSLLHFDHLYIGGGNALKIEGTLPPNVSTVSNDAGLEGGAPLWALSDDPDKPAAEPATVAPKRTRSQ